MASAIGWYGPLIDLSDAPSYVGDFVQLLGAVHCSTPVQYKLSRRGELIRTDILVGDDSRPRFTVAIWQKHLLSSAVRGDVILLQNVKVVKFGDVVEARTVHCSSIVTLVQPLELIFSEEVDELIQKCKVGIAAKEKLKKVIEWVKTSGSVYLKKQQLSRNWKMQKEGECKGCSSLAEVLHLSNSCKATFDAHIGEIFLPLQSRTAIESEKEKMFISCRVNNRDGTSLIKDFICTGCQICGSPMDLECSEHMAKQTTVPLYCDKSTDRLHVVGFIYRPFLLYVWDNMNCLPLLVRNKAAEILFGNIRADRVYGCFKGKLPESKSSLTRVPNHHSYVHSPPNGKLAGNKPSVVTSPVMERKRTNSSNGNIDLHYAWFIMLKLLLQPEKNSPLRFEITVNNLIDREEGRFEMVNLTMPCFTK